MTPKMPTLWPWWHRIWAAFPLQKAASCCRINQATWTYIRGLSSQASGRLWPIAACHQGLQSTQSCPSWRAEVGQKQTFRAGQI